jgi:hypothetical protein
MSETTYNGAKDVAINVAVAALAFVVINGVAKSVWRRLGNRLERRASRKAATSK